MRPIKSIRTLGFLSLVVFAALLVASIASAKSSSRSDRGTGGIPAVLQKLEEVQQQLDEIKEEQAQNAMEVAALRDQVETLDGNVTPCTLQRFRDGLCGPDNHPLDLMVSVCGSLESDAGLALKYAFTSNLDVQAGIGWKDAPDVHIVENAQLPAVLSLGPIPIVLPSELAGQASASAGLGFEGCLAPVRIPIGKSIAEPTVLAILEELEMQAQPVVDTLVGQLNSGSSASSARASSALAGDPGMGLANLSAALTAAAALRDQEIVEENPVMAFGRGPISDLALVLPVGQRVSSIMQDPGQLALPGMMSGSSGNALGDGSGLEHVMLSVCSGSGAAAASLVPLCDFIETRLPSVDRLLDLVPAIELIPDVVSEAVDGVRELLNPVLADLGETANRTAERFCDSTIGRRAIFNRLCGR